MELQWTARAMNERDDIYTYIAQDNPAAAARLDILFKRRAEGLRVHPLLGRPGRVPGTRELLAHRHYLLIYDVNDKQIRILRVMHTARQYPTRNGVQNVPSGKA